MRCLRRTDKDSAVFSLSLPRSLPCRRSRCNALSWVLVNKAAKFTAKSKGMKPFSNLLNLLKSGDVDTAVNTLTLLNSMIGTSRQSVADSRFNLGLMPESRPSLSPGSP